MVHKRDICVDLFHLFVNLMIHFYMYYVLCTMYYVLCIAIIVIKLASISRYNIVTSIVYEFKVKTLKNQKYTQING